MVLENVAADCAYGVQNRKKTRTEKDTKPIYAAEGYKKTQQQNVQMD